MAGGESDEIARMIEEAGGLCEIYELLKQWLLKQTSI